MIEILSLEEELNSAGVSLKVLGVGGAGSNAVNSMIQSGDMDAISFIVANTDAQALHQSPARNKVQLGKKITKGLGAGSNPEIGKRAAEEDIDAIKDLLDNTDILFLTAGLGGGTGSGALPIIAQAAREMGILTVGVVTKPFSFEGKRRAKHAEDAFSNIKGTVDTLIVVPNQKLLETADPKISMLNAFALSNDILKQAIKGISDIITRAGHINVDFADVRTIMKDTGMAIMGTGRASGPDRAKQAALRAISSPLLESTSIRGAKGVLINITGNEDLELQEINDAASMVYEMVNPEANIIMGSVIDKSLGNEICVTVIATGLDLQAASAVAAPTITPAVVQLVAAAPAPAAPAIANGDGRVIEIPAMHEIISPAPTPISQHIAGATSSTMHAAPIEESFDMDNLDTPTFMRKKAAEQAASAHDE
ncbi:cell division protein FtsZ [Candidatus Dependentiae bacterium]|nr:cell division protein FtsZ [Candidatus Dependentiae bacterium]